MLVVTHLFPTAADPTIGPWVAEQVDALSEFADVEVLCCARIGSNSTVVRETGARVTYRDTSTPFGDGRLGLIASSLRYAQHLRRYLRSLERLPSVVQSHFGFPDAVVVGREARRFRIPHVATLHGSDVARVLPTRVAGRAMRRAISEASAIACVSEALAAEVRMVLGPSHAVEVIPTGFDAALFCLKRTASREGALYVGNLRHVKGVDVLVDAWAIVAREERIPLVVVGEGIMRQELEARVERERLDGLVTFTGALDREDVAERMRRAKLLVLPSRNEGWGLVVAEALACGTPVVASRIGGIPEILSVPEGGLLVPPDDPDELSGAILAACRREWDRDTVAASSKAPTTRESARRLAELYGTLLT